MLVKAGANINWADKHKDTAANKALIFARFDLIEYFLNHGLNTYLEDLAIEVDACAVPPHSAAERGKERVIEMLKESGLKFPAFVPHRVQ